MDAPRAELLALLAACKKDPDDDHARLVLADWLEEHGDADDRQRAAFVRLEIESDEARGRPAFPHLRGRIWDAHAPRWAPFQTHLRKSAWTVASRGLVAATSTGKSPAGPHARQWIGTEAWAWVERLDAEPGKGDLPRLMGSPLLATLGTLALHRARDPALALAGPALEALRGLAFRDCSFGQAGLAPLFESPHAAGLRALDLGNTDLSPRDAAALAAGLPALAELALPPTFGFDDPLAHVLRDGGWRLRSLRCAHSVRRDGAGRIFDADPCAGLRRLVLAPKGDLDFAAFCAARFWGTLESLDLAYFALAPANALRLSRVAAPRLRSLALSGMEMKPDALKILAAAPWMSSLGRLDLTGHPLGPGAGEALAPMQAPLAMWLDRCRLGDEGAVALARWPGLACCRVLSLAENGIGEEGAAALAGSPYVRLAGLRLAGNPILDAGFARLLAAPWAAGLEALNVHSCGLSPEARVPAVPGAMKELLVGNWIVAAALRRALPGVPYLE